MLFEDEDMDVLHDEAPDRSIEGEQDIQDDMDIQQPDADDNANMDVDPDAQQEEEGDNPVRVQEPHTPYDKFMSAIVEHCPNLKDIALETHVINRHTCKCIHFTFVTFLIYGSIVYF